MHRAVSTCRAVPVSRTRLAITDLEFADSINDEERRLRRLTDLVELALGGTLSERHEAAAYLERHYGCVVTAPPAETVSVH